MFHHPALLFSLDQGDWAWLKRLPDGTFSNINPKTSNVFELVGRIVNLSMPVTEISIMMRCWKMPRDLQKNELFLQMKDMRHENVNPFLGFFHDCGLFAIVTEFCSRGSLEDLLQNDDVKLDWMFKSSLLLDLIKVSVNRREDKTNDWKTQL